MILTKLQDFIDTNAPVNRQQINQHFNMPATVLTDMLSLLTKKGKITRLQQQSCGGCTNCDGFLMESYSSNTQP
ncbi:MAG: FeoC-like transcriptional regulator [Gammaproteobacteria bacterium]|jgi:hypothetical protein|nr:FeoC-like transcriptional regulator [Gammaproteobacteria bacterium]